jgi:hypothetical protein
MIVKFKHENSWVFYECDTCSIDKVDVDSFEYETEKDARDVYEDTVESYIDYSRIKFPTKVIIDLMLVTFEKDNENTQSIFTNQSIYLLNDKGQTIERIN